MFHSTRLENERARDFFSNRITKRNLKKPFNYFIYQILKIKSFSLKKNDLMESTPFLPLKTMALPLHIKDTKISFFMEVEHV